MAIQIAIQIDSPLWFGEWLKLRRKTLDLTQSELAQQVGCAEVTVRKLESGVQRPSKQMALRVAEMLNIAADDQQSFVRFARGERPAPFATSRWSTQQPATNLLKQPTTLIGREQETASVCDRILHHNSRLVTLVGPPGVGKTRLAIEIAGKLAPHFGDGAFFVALATTQDPAFVPSVICQSLRLPESLLPANERLKLYLSERHFLLVLDNFEHLLAAAAWVAELLGACPWLTVLVTSRAPLRVRAEQQLPIPPLALPNLALLPGHDEVGGYPAIALFVERAQAVQPDFMLTELNKAAIAAICTQLDGLPLAIELVAARVNTLSPSELLARLRGALLLDSEGLRDAAPRHQSLRQAIDWSYKLLTSPEQRLLAQLGVFAGGFTLEVADEVHSAAGATSLDTVNGLSSLVDKNLLLHTDGPDGEPRFMMLETIREYALDRLVAGGESQIVRRRHAQTFLRLAESAEPHLRRVEQLGSLNYLDREHDNLRAALAWSLQEEGDALLALRLVNALSHFWFLRAYYSEGSRWQDAALAGAGESAPALIRAWALGFGSLLAFALDDFPRGRRLGEAALALARTLNDSRLIAYLAVPLSSHRKCQGEFEQATMLRMEGLNAARAVDDPWAITWNLNALLIDNPDPAQALPSAESHVALAREVGDRTQTSQALLILAKEVVWRGELKSGIQYLQEALALTRQINTRKGLIYRLQNLGQLYCAEGSYALAESHYREAFEMAYPDGAIGLTAQIILRFGELAQALGQPFQALQRYQQSLALVKELNHHVFVGKCLSAMATLGAVQESPLDAAQAMRLAGAAEAFTGGALFPSDLIDSTEFSERRSAIHNRLADPAMATAWAKGKEMSLNEAITYALTIV